EDGLARLVVRDLANDAVAFAGKRGLARHVGLHQVQRDQPLAQRHQGLEQPAAAGQRDAGEVAKQKVRVSISIPWTMSDRINIVEKSVTQTLIEFAKFIETGHNSCG